MNHQNKYNQIKQFVIKEKDLPLSCSGPDLAHQKINNMHPKIYLPIKEKKHLACPYCGTKYVFIE